MKQYLTDFEIQKESSGPDTISYWLSNIPQRTPSWPMTQLGPTKQTQANIQKTQKVQEPAFEKEFSDFIKSLFEKYKTVTPAPEYEKVTQKTLKPEEMLASAYRLALTQNLRPEDLTKLISYSWSVIPYLESQKPQTEKYKGVAPAGTAWTSKIWSLTPELPKSYFEERKKLALIDKEALKEFEKTILKFARDWASYYIQKKQNYNINPPQTSIELDKLPYGYEEVTNKLEEIINRLIDKEFSFGIIKLNPEEITEVKSKVLSQVSNALSEIPEIQSAIDLYSLADMFESLKGKIPTGAIVNNILRSKSTISSFL